MLALVAVSVALSGRAIAKAPPASGDCTAQGMEAARTRANAQMTKQAYGAALETLDGLLACKPSDADHLEKVAFMAACGAKNAKRAKALFAKLIAKDANAAVLKQICLRSGIDPSK
jgi:hypothetical protein